MTAPAARNPRIPTSLSALVWIESGVALAAAANLFFAPAAGSRIWAWSPPPFHTRFLGAIYFAAFMPLLLLSIYRRWAPGRLVLWMTLTFTSSIMVVMIFYPRQFEWSRPVAWAFWVLLVLLPLLSAGFLARLRTWPPVTSDPLPPPWPTILRILALLLGSYGAALLAAPLVTASFWPWPVDDFHGRIYAAIFMAPGVGAWLVGRRGHRSDSLALGLTLATLGAFTLVGLAWTNAIVPPERHIDLGAAGTVLFLGMNVAFLLLGGALALAALRPANAPA
ncbi:MAG TPA: hypothetical protein VLD63_15270 [Anaerolineales bacterium]|nr:hypothetical protein [Anaerolineales bacterium]